MRIDVAEMKGAILNLVKNADDAIAGEDEIRLSVSRGTAQEGDQECVILTVADNGAGMPEEVRANALTPFYTTKEIGKGTGLGLPMVQGLVRSCGGSLEIESEDGKGTVIRTYLPPHRKEA